MIKGLEGWSYEEALGEINIQVPPTSVCSLSGKPSPQVVLSWLGAGAGKRNLCTVTAVPGKTQLFA